MDSRTKTCQNCKKDFIVEPDDFAFYEKMKVPPPTFCPECRRQRRRAWRNLINFHKSKCGLTGASVISIYAPASGITAYSPIAWNSDKWSALDYGQDYDFSRPFFLQYSELVRKVPKPSMDNDDGMMSVNCMYTNDFALGKDCYLALKSWKVENVMYSFQARGSKDLVDIYLSDGGDEFNYETINTNHCYQCRFVFDSIGCSDSAFCYDCRNCSDCFMCTGVRGKSYCFKNKEIGKDAYTKIINEYALHTYSGTERAKSDFEIILRNHPRKALRMTNCKDCLGDLMHNSYDCKYCFIVAQSEHHKYGDYSDGIKDSYDADAGGGSELAYETDVAAYCSRIIGSRWAWYCQDSYYLSHMFRSKNCFGCDGLKDAQYCILNKQYTKKEYEELIPKIIKHMYDMPYVDAKGRRYVFGDYFPIELSDIPYNESMAQSLYPLSKEQVNKENFYWLEKEDDKEQIESMSFEELPDSIFDVKDDIMNKAIISKAGRKYRITAQELNFYRKHKIPLPRESFFERHDRRERMATSFRIYSRASDKSGLPIMSSYPADAPEKVWSIEEYKTEFD